MRNRVRNASGGGNFTSSAICARSVVDLPEIVCGFAEYLGGHQRHAMQAMVASLRVEAEQACALRGNVRVSTGAEDTEILSVIHDGDQVTFNISILKTAPKKIRLRFKPGKSDCTLSVHLDQNCNNPIAKAKIIRSPNGQWAEIFCDVVNISGMHAVMLNFHVQGQDGPLIDWWKFE